MKKFFVLYMVPAASIDEMMKTTTPEERNEWMGKWTTWMEAQKGFFVDPGAPMGKTTRVTSSGTSEARNEVTGYAIVNAESREDAAKVFATSPHLTMPGAYVDVMDIMQM